MTGLEAITIGLSIYTWHPANDNPVQALRLENNTPGIYARTDDFMVAVFRNSFGRTSVLGALNYKAGPFDFSIGAATGYQKRAVTIPCSAELFREHGMTPPRELPSYGCTGWMGSTTAVLKPMVAVSYRVPFEVMGVAPRVSFMGNALNLSIEATFK